MQNSSAQPPSKGLIDIHSHLLPGIDDGCATLDESVACVRQLISMGFAGSICTPHCGDDFFPDNTPTHLQAHFHELQQHLHQHGLQYQLWLGAELRLSKSTPDYIREHGVCTLAGGKHLLMDVWDPTWPKWAPPILQQLIDQGYQPIMAHPERMGCQGDIDKALLALQKMGVLLQGNYRSMTGEEGYQADRKIRQWLREKRYQFLALDMHSPDSLDGRFDGLRLVEAEFTPQSVVQLTEQAPHSYLFATTPAIR